jgi:transposase
VLTREQLEPLSKDELIEIILKLDARVSALEAQLREAHRAKAPFGKGTLKANPKRPGRHVGNGKFSRRSQPVAAPSDVVQALDAPLPVDQRNCPECNTPLVTHNEEVTVEDIPPQPQRVIKLISVEVGKCPICGFTARGHHPSMGTHQWGANAHQLGPRVLAHALALHYDSGLPLRKVPKVIAELTGITLSQSALTQRAGKLCEEGGLLAAHYQNLREEVANSAVVNTDDTGWRIGATLAFVMGFFTGSTAYYQIRSRHRHQEVLEVIGADFAGKLGTDRGKSYEAQAMDGFAMQKCLSHLLKNLSEVEACKTGRAKSFSRQLKATLREGLALWQSYQAKEMSLSSYRKRGAEIERTLDHQLRQRELSDEDNARLLKGIRLQHERGRLSLFLHEPEIEPTNNRAERGLRPVVIARKVSQCSKNERGANSYAMLRTIFETLRKRTADVIGAFTDLLCAKPFPSPSQVR